MTKTAPLQQKVEQALVNLHFISYYQTLKMYAFFTPGKVE